MPPSRPRIPTCLPTLSTLCGRMCRGAIEARHRQTASHEDPSRLATVLGLAWRLVGGRLPVLEAMPEDPRPPRRRVRESVRLRSYSSCPICPVHPVVLQTCLPAPTDLGQLPLSCMPTLCIGDMGLHAACQLRRCTRALARRHPWKGREERKRNPTGAPSPG